MAGRERRARGAGQVGWFLALAVAAAPAVARPQVLLRWDCESGNIADYFEPGHYSGGSGGWWGAYWGSLSTNANNTAGGYASVLLAFADDSEADALRKSGLGNVPELYFRRYVRWGSQSGWANDWPGAHTLAVYLTSGDPGSWEGGEETGHAFVAEQLLYSPDPACWDYGVGQLRVVLPGMGQEIVAAYPTALEVGLWYKVETWLRMNTAINRPDGILAIWIDGQLVLSKQDLVLRSDANPIGTGFEQLVVGGRLTAGTCGVPTGATRNVYVDDFSLSASLGRDAGLPFVDGGLDGGPEDSGHADAGVDAGPPDAGIDAGAPDAGTIDAGIDAGSPDAGLLDAGVVDAGADAGPRDAGTIDAGVLDAGTDAGSPDAGLLDAGVVDAGTDAGPRDAGTIDAGVLDAGTDAGAPDAGHVDAGVIDAGSDAGAPDAGTIDAGVVDAGTDAGVPDASNPDAGPRPDASGGDGAVFADAASPSEGLDQAPFGCWCAQGTRGGGLFPAALLVVAWGALRRRGATTRRA